MEFVKQFHKHVINKNGFCIEVSGPLSPEEIARSEFHEGLVAFRQAEEQHKALISIAELPEARIIVSKDGNQIIGYVTFLYPDPLERWSEANMQDLLELGAIEVAPAYRHLGLGKEMLRIAFLDPAMEDFIVITTEYYWHWDLNGTGLNIWEYRKIMEKMMESAGLTWYATDDPEICSHPANCLMARIGANVPVSSIEAFDRIRFKNRFMY